MSNTHYHIHGYALELCNAFGFMFPGELFLMQALVQSLPDDAVLVQIGAGVGTGSLGMAEMHPKAQIYTVDISQGGPEGGMQNEKNAFAKTGLTLPHQILGNSQVVHKDWTKVSGNQMIDLLFIDGDHSEQACQGDIDGWVPHVRPGGYVLFHDYNSVMWGALVALIDANMDRKNWRKVLKVDTLIAFQRTGK